MLKSDLPNALWGATINDSILVDVEYNKIHIAEMQVIELIMKFGTATINMS